MSLIHFLWCMQSRYIVHLLVHFFLSSSIFLIVLLYKIKTIFFLLKTIFLQFFLLRTESFVLQLQTIKWKNKMKNNFSFLSVCWFFFLFMFVATWNRKPYNLVKISSNCYWFRQLFRLLFFFGSAIAINLFDRWIKFRFSKIIYPIFFLN